MGYVRPSASAPTPVEQLLQLKEAGCEEFCWERTAESMPLSQRSLQTLIDTLEPGDTLVVTRLDRLALSLKDLMQILIALDTKGVTLRTTEQAIDTGTERGRFLLLMLELLIEFETFSRKERQLHGVARAKVNGVYKGRKPRINASRVLALHKTGKPPAAIAHELKIAPSSVYRLLNQKRSSWAARRAIEREH